MGMWNRLLASPQCLSLSTASILAGCVALTAHAADPQVAPSPSIVHADLEIAIIPERSGPQPKCRIIISPVSPKNPLLGGVSHLGVPDPARIVIDLTGLKLKAPKKFTTADQSCISKVRFGQHPQAGRIVFDLADSEQPVYSLSQRNESLVILVNGAKLPDQNPADISPTAQPSPTASATATNTPASSPTSLPTIAPTQAPTHTHTSVPTVESPELLALSISTPTPTASPSRTTTAIPTATTTPFPPTPSASATALDSSKTKAVIEAPEKAELKFSVDQVLVELPSGRREVPVKNVLVTNISEETLHMTARAAEIINPGSEDEREELTKELLVSPAMFALEPGAQRRVRIVGDPGSVPDSEKVFRVHLAPLQEDFDTAIRLQVNGVKARLNIVTALAITVLRAPSDEGNRPEIQATWDNNKDSPHATLKLHNAGNRSVGLISMKICLDPIASTGCRDIPNRRLFAGESIVLKLPHGGVIQGMQTIGDEFQALRIEEQRREE